MEFIQLMRVFSKLAELGSFTKVSDAMEIGRPQVTVAIQELENKLGVRLFQRTTRKVSLTQEGESFYQRAEEILRSVSEISTMFGTSGAPPYIAYLSDTQPFSTSHSNFLRMASGEICEHRRYLDRKPNLAALALLDLFSRHPLKKGSPAQSDDWRGY